MGLKTATEFQSSLKQNQITVNPYLAGLIKKNEAGEPITFQKFGVEIFKQSEAQDTPDGRFMRSLSPQVLTKVERITAAVKTDIADKLMERGVPAHRYMGQTYVPIKGRNKTAVDQRYISDQTIIKQSSAD